MKTLFKTLVVISFIFSSMVAADLSLANRTASDIKRDATSKPAEVIKFSGVKQGDSVLDLLGGGGYYTELLSRVVGEQGSVVLHNNKAYLPYIGKELASRLANDRLANVTKLMSEADALNLGKNQFDVAFFVLGYHDLFVIDKNWTVTAEQVIPQLFKALKPGGRLLVIDHNAAKGVGSEQAQKFHRVEGEFVKADLAARGFKFIKESALLANPQDPMNISVFDPSIRRNTDRFMMLFEKQ